MGKRAAIASTEAEVTVLPLPALNQQIAWMEYRAFKMKLSSSLRKSAAKRLVWLEAKREALYGIVAPKRR